ncbi:mitochondrial phosphate carrier protein 3, mitochondrial-like protein [Tanacetum coccineum]
MDPLKYTSVSSGFKVLLLKEQGVRSLFKGWSPTLIGYGAQGACRFGFYEFFKKYYSDVAGPEYATKYPALIYMAASSSAEVIQGIGAALETSDTIFKSGFLAGSVCAFAFPHCADELAFIQTLRAEHAVKKVGAWDVLRLVRPQILQMIIIGILTGVQWGMHDAFKLSFGLPASGGGAPT